MAGTAGIVATGHQCTSDAAVELLAAGGNAFDAALGALCTATVCEPLLTSLGGGGFLMAQTGAGESLLYDFFAQTPSRKAPADDINFFPILADFGTAKQEFHIGLGSMAVPGIIAGIFEVHRRHCRLDIGTIMAPAIRLAREGVLINDLQYHISHILLAILEATPAAMRLVATAEQPGRIAQPGARVDNPGLADTLEALASEGPDLFYRGELAQRLVRDCLEGGGMLSLADLENYQVEVRSPIEVTALGAQLEFNAPPSPGGTLMAFALGLLDKVPLSDRDWGSREHCLAAVNAMRAASRLRRDTCMHRDLDRATAERLLAPAQLDHWRQTAMPGELFSRGTTHLSVIDAEGNVASLTTTNGEGCAYVLPGTGIMMNNMLGEEDLNPDGFHLWREDIRLASMMCPSVARLADGGRLALGSGGSNRIRSAVLQVLVNLLTFQLPLERAVMAPRMHLEGDKLSIENGLPEDGLEALRATWPNHQVWPEPNIFFGGVHAVQMLADGSLLGAGDPRRGGVVARNE